LNNARFLNLNDENLSVSKKEELLDEFLEHLHNYCDQLCFEIGEGIGEKQELIITTEGKSDYFKYVEELIDNAPPIENWYYTSFIQPRDLDYTSDFEDVKLKPLEIWFLPLDNKNKPQSIGLQICLPNYEAVKSSKWLKPAVFKMLDAVLGEKSFALDIEHVAIGSLPVVPEDHGMIELKELRAFIKWKKKKLGIS
jgi:hypothetical protein